MDGNREQLGQVVLIEGNISAGKTTVARKLGEELGYRTFFEPTVSNPYLELFYADPKKFALRMQIWLLRQRHLTYISALRHAVETGQGVILDRSVFSDWVFAAKNLADGNIDADGYRFYEKLRAQLLADLPLPDTIIFLDVSPEECHRRILDVRKRDCESTIALSYLQGLDDCYRQWTASMSHNGTTTAYAVAWENFGDHTPISQHIQELKPHEARLPMRTLKLLYNKDEIRKTQQIEHDLWSEDEHEHSMLDHDDANDMERNAHTNESQSTSEGSITDMSITSKSSQGDSSCDEERDETDARRSPSINKSVPNVLYDALCF